MTPPEERNQATLHRALRELPAYEPGEQVWAAIADQLEQAEEQALLQAMIRELPDFEAPPAVWRHIARDLEQAPAPVIRRPRLGRRFRAVAAAVAAVAVLLSWLILPHPVPEAVDIVHSQETLPEPAPREDWNDDAGAFEEVRQLYADHPWLREAPDYRSLSDELRELDEAKTEVETILEQYGHDARLVRQMGEIERQRSEVLRRLVALI